MIQTKKILFLDGASDSPDELRSQLLSGIKSHIPETINWRDIARGTPVQHDEITVSLFTDVPADIFLMFDLSDRNYFLLNNRSDVPLVQGFERILVPGPWLRDAILANPRLGATPEQVVCVGSPRIDMLRRMQAAQATDKPAGTTADPDRPRILFVPISEGWKEADGTPMTIKPQMEQTLALLDSHYDLTVIEDGPNRPAKQPITQELLDADVVITDYASVMYEAWALGKPVIFPRWLTGDRVLAKAPKSAEAHVYRERIGHHPDSMVELFDLLDTYPQMEMGEQVTPFLDSYVTHLDRSDAVIANLLRDQCDASAVVQRHLSDHKLTRAIADKDWQTAHTEAARLIAMTPASAKYLDIQANIFTSQGNMAAAAATLRQALQIDRNNADLHNRLGTAYRELGQNHDAAQAWQRAIDLKPSLGTSAMYYKLGFTLETPGRDGKSDVAAARTAYVQACMRDKKHNADTYGVGMLHGNAGRWKEAQAPLRKTLLDLPLDPELHYRLGMAHDRCYEWEEAATCYFRALALAPKKAAWHYRLGFVRERQGRFEEAAAAYASASALSAKPKANWRYREGYVLEKTGDLAAACAAYAAVVPDAQAEVAFAPAYQDQMLRTHADMIHALLDRYPDDVALWARYAQALVACGDITAALRAARAACQRTTTPDAAHIKLRDTLAVRAQRGTEIRTRLDYDCTSSAEWLRYSQAQEDIGDLDTAIAAMRQAVMRSNAHDTKLFHRLGVLLTRADRLPEACDAFRSQHILQRPHGTFETKFTQSAALRETATYREFFDVLPLMEKTVFYESFGGEGCSDNPLAMFNQIDNDPRFDGWLHIWSIRGTEKIPPRLRNREDVVFIEKESPTYQRYLATAPYLINNGTFPFYYTRRTGQHYLNTWHGTPLKTLGYDVEATPLQRANTARNLVQASMFIAPNTHTEDVMLGRYGIRNLFTGTSLISGYPRIDMLINADEDEKKRIITRLGLDPSKPIVLFAPTYRGHWATPELEAEQLAGSIERMKSDKYNLVFRGHYFAEKFIAEMDLDVTIAPHAIDTCSLLSIVDVLVTDYSSIFYDFLITKRPVIHFVPDWDYYVETRGMYFGKDQLPGLICEDEASLLKTLKDCVRDPEGQITQQYKDDLERYCSREDGKSAERVVQALFFDVPPDPVQADHPDGKRHFVYFAGVCDDGPALRNLRGLTATTAQAGHINTVLVDRFLIINNEARTANTQALLPYTDVVMRFGRATLSLEEAWIDSKIKTPGFVPHPEMLSVFEAATDVETRRMIGHTHFDAVLDLETARPFWTRSMAEFSADVHIAQLGGDIDARRAVEGGELEVVTTLLPAFDVLASYTDPLSAANKRALKLRGPAFATLPPFVSPDMDADDDQPAPKGRHLVCFTDDPATFLAQSASITDAIGEGTQLTLFVPSHLLDSVSGAKAADLGFGNLTVLPDTHDALPAMQQATLVVFAQKGEANPVAFAEAHALGRRCLVRGGDNLEKPGVMAAASTSALIEKLAQFMQKPAAPLQPKITQHNKAALADFMALVDQTAGTATRGRTAR